MNDLNTHLTNKSLYRIAAVSAVLTVLIMLAEIFLTLLPEGTHASAKLITAEDWFMLFERDPFMALRNLGLINMIATTLTIPVFLGLVVLHWIEKPVLAGFSLILFLASYAIFMADNVAFPMLALSGKYLTSASADQKQIFLAAGEALLVRGQSHTPGTFPGFFLSELSNIMISLVILMAGKMKKSAGIFGLVAFGALFAFEVLASFFPERFMLAMRIAIPGGIAALVWYVLLAIDLRKAGR